MQCQFKLLLPEETVAVLMRGSATEGKGQSSRDQIMSSSSVDSRDTISSFLHVFSNFPHMQDKAVWYETSGSVEVAIQREAKNPVSFIHS